MRALALLLLVCFSCNAQLRLRDVGFVGPVKASASASFPSGATHYWTFNEAALSTRVDTPGTADFTVVSTVGSVSGKNNNAAQFSAAASVGEEIATSESLTKPTDFTVAAWMRLDSGGAASGALSFILDGTADAFVRLNFQEDGTASVFFSEEGTIGTTGLTLDAWHLFVARNAGGSGASAFFVDGASVGTGTFTAAGWSTLKALCVGTGTGIVGQMDEPCIFDRVLSDTEISNMWNGGTGRFGP